jgi:hypothetical protein
MERRCFQYHMKRDRWGRTQHGTSASRTLKSRRRTDGPGLKTVNWHRAGIGIRAENHRQQNNSISLSSFISITTWLPQVPASASGDQQTLGWNDVWNVPVWRGRPINADGGNERSGYWGRTFAWSIAGTCMSTGTTCCSTNSVTRE